MQYTLAQNVKKFVAHAQLREPQILAVLANLNVFQNI
jgi:hypothetical protein